MKIKHRALALILAAMMVLTYMPAMAFAGEEEPADESTQPVAAEEVQEEAAPAEEPAPTEEVQEEAAPAVKASSEAKSAGSGNGYWYAEAEDEEVNLDETGMAQLSVNVTYEYESVDEQPELRLWWYDWDDEKIGEGESITVDDTGTYYCEVAELDENNEVVDSTRTQIYFYVYPFDSGDNPEESGYWWLDWESRTENLYNGKAKLSVFVRCDGEEPDLTIKWYNGDEIIDNNNVTEITVNAPGTYTCYATDGKMEDTVEFTVYDGKYWDTEFNGDTYILPGETAVLKVDVSIDKEAYDEEGLDEPTFTYSWFKCDVTDDGQEEIRIPIEGVTGNTFETGDEGEYVCVVADNRGNKEEVYLDVWLRNTEGGWYVYDEQEGSDHYLSQEGNATLSVIAEAFEGELPDNITYTWYIGTSDQEEYVEDAHDSTFEVNEEGEYACVVSDGIEAHDKCVNFRVYEYEAEYTYIDWGVDFDSDAYFLQNGSATLTANTYYFGEGSPTYIYKWYKDDVLIDDATSESYVATEAGEYKCEVEININGETETAEVSCEVYSWRITNDEQDFEVEYGESITLQVTTDYEGEDAVYQWGTDESMDEFVPIEGANDPSYTVENVTEEGRYFCQVTIDGVTQTGAYYIEPVFINYEWEYLYPNAVATYKAHDDRKLTVNYTYDEEEEDGRDRTNFPEPGDTIVMTSGSDTEEYVYDEENGFVNDEGEILDFEVYTDTADASTNKVNARVSTKIKPDPVNKKVEQKYDTEMSIPVSYTTNVKSIKFDPSNISLYSEDIKEIEDGQTYYYLKNRNKNGDSFIPGDKLTVTYEDGTTKVFIGDADGDFEYKNGSEHFYISPEIDRYSLKAGNNTVKLYYQGRVASINVFMDTPQLRAERAAAAAAAAKAKADAEAKAKAAAAAKAAVAIRQGIPDSSLPKIKAKKPAAKKTSITVKWTKLNKKQLKKSKATHYEIWVSESSSYPAGATTKEKIVKKSKSSWTCKGLKKNKKYFVRIRAIKYVGGAKHVGPWKQMRIKTKKK